MSPVDVHMHVHIVISQLTYIVQGIFQNLAYIVKNGHNSIVLVGISSNFLQSIRTSMCIRKCNKNWGDFYSFLMYHCWVSYLPLECNYFD